jgi:RNA polymerase sigma-70 factor (ECF subfamily)
MERNSAPHDGEPFAAPLRITHRGNVELPDPLTLCSDEELLLRFRRGEQDLFGLLVRRYQRELYGYLCRYLGDTTLAEDVFQNTFLQLFIKSDQYEEGRPLRSWLYTIATNQAIDALRRQSRHQAISLEQAQESRNGEAQNLLEMLESRDASPLELAAGEERRELVKSGIEQLPEFLKQVLLLAYYQGLKYREIADILNIPVGTVKSRLHTALARLHEAGTSPSFHEV